MASKQVSEILVRLGIQGLQGLDKLKSSFRELEKSLGPSAATIERARESIIAFGREGRNTEQVIKGQIEALRGLQSQTERGSTAWAELAGDIERFRQASRRTDQEISILRESILSVATGSNQSQQSLRSYIADLGRLRNEATITGSVFSALGNDISELTARLEQAETQTTQTGRAFGRVLGQALASTSAGAKQQIQDLGTLINEQRELIDSIDARSAKERRLKKYIEERAEAEDRLNRALAQRRQATYQESARTGRETVRSAAAAFADPDFLRTISPEALDKRLGELPNTTAGLNQGLSELSERLANTKRNTVDYLIVAMQMAGVQRELTAVTQGYAQALLMGIRTGTVAPSARNLQEVITALRAEMSQLDVTTSEGARAYAENAREARALEQRLNGLANAYRHVGDMAAQAATAETSAATARITANYLNRGLIRQQEQAMAELGQRVRAGVAATPLALPAAGQTTAPGTGLEISGGARVGRATGRIQRFFTRFDVGDAQLQMPGAPQAQGPQATEQQAERARRAAISEAEAVRTAAEARRQAERQIQSYRAEIDKARRADIGSIDSTQRLREAINQYRSTLPGASAEFKKLTKELGQLDARSEKLGRGLARRRMTGMQVAQAAGAAVSGGIFGGPEGFLGGALGGVFGGVGGAFAGAAAGAQIGALRQQLGGFADYAAQIQKMEIALKNAAGGQAEFNQAVAAAASATQNLNVPQDIAIQGMTKLTAAVKGAGGQVTDAELVFRSVTSAIKATGGSAEDVDGAITAMVQVFSKGKVSAEELSGQLGERLPGAVTKFAKANDMTLPELQKALEQGQVGLNELMNFIVQLGDEYSGVAEKIAGSSQDAGARLTVAYNNMRIAVGEALQPIGAAFQEAFIPFIEGITPVLVEVLPKIGEFALALAKNFDTLAIAAAAALGVFAVGKIAAIGGVGAALLQLATAAGAASVSLKALNAAALLNPWTALAAGVAAVGVAFYEANKEKERFDAVIRSGTTDELAAEFERLQQKIIEASSKTASYSSDIRGVGNEAGYASIEIRNMRNELEKIKSEYRVRLLFEQAGLDPEKGFYTPVGKSKPTRTEFPRLVEDENRKAKSEADKAAREAQRRFDEQLQNMLREEDHTLKKFALEEKIRLEREKQSAVQAGTLDSEMQLAEIANQRLDLDIRSTALASENTKLDELRKQGLAEGLDVQKIAQKMQQNIIEDLGIQYENQRLNTQEIEAQIDLEKERENLNRALNQELQDRRYELGLITKEEYNRLQIERERRRLEEQYRGLPGAQGRIEEGVDLFRREIDPTFAEGLQSQLAVVRRELDELTKPINQVVGAATAIGDAFSQSFASVINGSATTQEALASFFQNLANYFLDMAAQIIQKMIVMAILNQIVGLLPGSGGEKGGDTVSQIISGGRQYPVLNAKGNVYAQNGIQPFAMGGIVNKPTLFRYADGGSGRFGLMGEAGPEAIIPLKRGRDGKLGVAGGGGVNVGTINITVQNTGENLNPAAQKQIAGQVRGLVLATLANEKRSGGMLR